MIYERVEPNVEIRQGDIFRNIPMLEIDLEQIPVIINDAIEVTKWSESTSQSSNSPIQIIAEARPILGIVITQDCDAVRSPFLSLCEIAPFREVERKAANASSPKAWVSLITTHARVNQKWFYLPSDDSIGFADKMAADFTSITQVRRLNLEALLPTNRIGRLNNLAEAHFRERISEFFRRYPYDEWYTLDRDELNQYNKIHNPPVDPFDWQK